MSLSYIARLVFLCLGSFFLVNALLTGLTGALAPAAIRLSLRLRPRPGARLLLGLRLMPATVATIFVAALCIPSYLRLEHRHGAERVGMLCLATAALAVTVWAISLYRGARAAAVSRRYLQQLRSSAQCVTVEAGRAPVWVTGDASPLLALAGVLRPQLVVSRRVIETLSAEQLAVALRHEDSHRRSLDNGARLLLLLTPGPLPGVQGFRRLDRAWARLAEWAADDAAVRGDSGRSLSLASALVRVARMGTPRMTPQPLNAIMTSLVPDTQDLRARVDRLLSDPKPDTCEKSGRPWGRWTANALLACCLCGLTAAMMQASTMHATHELLEHLIH